MDANCKKETGPAHADGEAGKGAMTGEAEWEEAGTSSGAAVATAAAADAPVDGAPGPRLPAAWELVDRTGRLGLPPMVQRMRE
jgi:hypothetical protein